MVGDWVYGCTDPYDKDEEQKKYPVKVIKIDIDGDTWTIGNNPFTEPYEDEWWNLEPIPITPEILEKNGFERRDDLVERIEDPLPFIYEDKETTESVSVGWRDSYDNGLRDENAEYFEEYWKIWIDAFDARYEKTARILYVHELQHALRLVGIKKEIVL